MNSDEEEWDLHKPIFVFGCLFLGFYIGDFSNDKWILTPIFIGMIGFSAFFCPILYVIYILFKNIFKLIIPRCKHCDGNLLIQKENKDIN